MGREPECATVKPCTDNVAPDSQTSSGPAMVGPGGQRRRRRVMLHERLGCSLAYYFLDLWGHGRGQATAQLLAAIRDLKALDGPDGQGYHLQGDAGYQAEDDDETLTHL